MRSLKKFTRPCICYDDAGSAKNASEDSLAGIAVFERRFHLDKCDCGEDIAGNSRDLESTRTNAVRTKLWRRLGHREQRRVHLRHALATIRSIKGEWALFGIVVEIQSKMLWTLQQLCSRFDSLGRMHRQHARGRDHGSRRAKLDCKSARDFRANGHRKLKRCHSSIGDEVGPMRIW